MSKTKLLPCPFCGRKDIKTGSSGYSFGIDNYIKCNFCGAKIQMSEEYGMEELVKRWNTRKPIDDIVEKLEDYQMWKKFMIYDLTHREHNIIKKAIEIVRNAGKDGGIVE